MVLSSAAASTQTTILPTARTTLAMGVYKAIPNSFSRIHKRFLTPTVSTVAMGAVSIVLYVILNYVSAGTVIADAVSALGVMIAFYYGLTGLSCVWYYRDTLTESPRNLWLRGILPGLGGVMLWGALGYNLWFYWQPVNSFTSWQMTFPPHWDIGGVFLIDLFALVLGLVMMFAFAAVRPAFFRGETLNKSTKTLVPESLGAEVGLFGIRENDDVPNS
jgi:amino acid transporter